ncbi:MAG TPA: hypothetical protein VJL58_11625 [Pyrinomonadaceae bacterium]|nr:hypothetical protein [Pyrinomonadaceae bacterium]
MFANCLKTLLTATAVVLLVQTGCFAQKEDSVQASLFADPGAVGHHKIVGMWDTVVTIRVCATGTPITSFAAIGLFNTGGTFNNTDTQNPATVSSVPGIWAAAGPNQYNLAFKVFRFNTSGAFIGSTVVRHVLTLSDSGDEYTSEGTSAMYDATGTQISTGCSTTEAQRFQ